MALWTYPIIVRRESVFITGLASRRRRISDVLMMMNRGGRGRGGAGWRDERLCRWDCEGTGGSWRRVLMKAPLLRTTKE